jgi:signal transduction histidine kinase
VARAAPPEEVLAAVTEEAGRLLDAAATVLARYDPDGTETPVGVWSATGTLPVTVGTRTGLGGRNVSTLVFQTGQPARIDDFADVSGPAGTHARAVSIRASVGAPGRRRIEQDLHDGAQQPLVALAVRLRAAQAAVPPELGELGAELDRAVSGATGALHELREIARGIHPAVLAKGGLRFALNALARRSPVPVDLQVRADGRLPEPVEVSTYYIVAEALTNAAKHARASAIGVEAEVVGDLLRVTVRDDGAGGADLAGGSGLAGLKDRMEALGGRIVLHSPRGAGTSLRAELPLTATNDGVTSR